jgi:cytochrome c556
MRVITKAGLLVIGLSLALPAFAADRDPKKDAINARKAEMTLRAFNAGPLFAMAKGDMPYNAELAATLAGNLKVLLGFNNRAAWMPGTDNKAYPDDTTALPKLWENMAELGKLGKAYGEVVSQLAEVAGSGADAMGAKVGELGKACKNCHEEFREKK